MVSMMTPVKCSSCSKRILLQDVTYSADGKKLICEDCKLLENEPKQVKIEPPKMLKRSGQGKGVVSSIRKTYYTCRNCHYKFSRAESFGFNGVCPYCGRKDGVEKDSETYASTLLKNF